MSKKPIDPEVVYQPDPKRKHPPIDKEVRLPHQVLHAAATADALSKGQPVPPAQPHRTRSKQNISYTDAEIDQALRSIGDLQAKDPRLAVIIALAREGAQHIKARRRGAREPREKSENVTRRLEAVLQEYRQLPRHLQKRPTGKGTLLALRRRISAKLSPQQISEDTIKKDIEHLGSLLRLVRQGVIPRAGTAIKKQNTIPERTRQEMEAGKRAVTMAKVAVANKPQKPSDH